MGCFAVCLPACRHAHQPAPVAVVATCFAATDTVAAVRAERTRLIAKLESSLHGSLSGLGLHDTGGSSGSPKRSKGSVSSAGKGLTMVEMVRRPLFRARIFCSARVFAGVVAFVV